MKKNLLCAWGVLFGLVGLSACNSPTKQFAWDAASAVANQGRAMAVEKFVSPQAIGSCGAECLDRLGKQIAEKSMFELLDSLTPELVVGGDDQGTYYTTFNAEIPGVVSAQFDCELVEMTEAESAQRSLSEAEEGSVLRIGKDGRVFDFIEVQEEKFGNILATAKMRKCVISRIEIPSL